jgi:hypothetical protein
MIDNLSADELFKICQGGIEAIDIYLKLKRNLVEINQNNINLVAEKSNISTKKIVDAALVAFYVTLDRNTDVKESLDSNASFKPMFKVELTKRIEEVCNIN